VSEGQGSGRAGQAVLIVDEVNGSFDLQPSMDVEALAARSDCRLKGTWDLSDRVFRLVNLYRLYLISCILYLVDAIPCVLDLSLTEHFCLIIESLLSTYGIVVGVGLCCRHSKSA
jgi:hypothetical protein